MEFLLKKLQDVASQLMDVLPSLISALVVLLIGWLFARVLSRVIERVLKAIRIDVLAERVNNIDLLKGSNLSIKPSILISRVVYYVIMLIVIAVSADFLKLKILSNQVESLIEYIPSLITAALIMVFGLLLANMVKEVVAATFRSVGMSTGPLISNVIFYFLFISVALSAMRQAFVETSFIENNLTIIIAGVMLAFAIGYGFASRSVMANFLGSLYTKPKFRIGENIRIKDLEGKIIGIDNTAMTLRTSANKRVIIPLSMLAEEQVEILENWEDGTLIEKSDEAA